MRKTVEEKIKELEENREEYTKERVGAFEKKLRATYQARIDLLRVKGPKVRKKRREEGQRSLGGMMEKARDRYLFFQHRYYELMGEDGDKARDDYEKFRLGWIHAISRGAHEVEAGQVFSPQIPSHTCFICGRPVHGEKAITDAKLLEKYTGQTSEILCCSCFKVAKTIIDGKEVEVSHSE